MTGVVHVHEYASLITRTGQRTRRAEINGPTRVGDILGPGMWCCIAAGRAVDADDMVDAGDVLHIAPRPGDAGTIILVAIAVLSAAASYLLTPKVRAPSIGSEKSEEQRFGFGRFSSDAAAGDRIPVPMGHLPRYGGKIVSKVPGDGADGDQRVRILITYGFGGTHGIQSIGDQTADFDGLDGADVTGIFLNDQPVANFQGVKLWGRLGTDDQEIIPGFDDTEVLREVGTGDGVILRNTDGSDRVGSSPSGEAYSFSTVAAVNAVTLRIRVDQGLYTIAGTGQVEPRTVRFRYRSRTSDTGSGAGSWSAWTVVTLSKAEESQFYSSPRLDLTTNPDGEFYDVEVERVTAESGNVADRDTLVWDAVKEVTYAENTYAGFAMLAVELTAGEQLTGIPNVSAEIEGIKVRVHDGLSDPSEPEFDVAYTANPAYLALELLTNPTWGLGATYTDADIDLAGLIQWAEYCDEPIDLFDASGQIPRYAFNLAIEEPRAGMDWLRSICQAGACTPTQFGNIWRFVVDRPQPSPVEIFTDASIATDENGFPIVMYEREVGTRGIVRPNQLVCQFANELAAGEPDVISYPELGELWLAEEDPNPKTMKLEGVTHPEQVMRHLKREMKRIRFLERTVKFRTTHPVVALQPGERFDLATSVVGWGLASGRVVEGSSPATIKLDREITLAPSTSYVVRVVHQDGTIEAKAITSTAGTYAAGVALNVASAWTDIPARWDEYALGASGVEVKPFTCQRVSLEDPAQLLWQVEGIEYDDEIYDDSADDVTFPDYGSLNTGKTPPGPLLSLTAFERIFQERRQVALSWRQASADAEITTTFHVYRRRTGTGTWVRTPVASVALRGAVLDIDVEDVAYEFIVVPISVQGAFLSPYDERHPIASVVFGLAAPPLPPPVNLTITQTGGNTYALTWDAVDGAVAYVVMTGGDAGTGLPNDGAEDCLILARVDTTSLTGLELPPGESITFWVRSVGANGRMSFTAASVTEADPALPPGQTIKQSEDLDLENDGTLTDLAWDGSQSRLELDGEEFGVYRSEEFDTGSLTACELTFRIATANDAADPDLEDFDLVMPSIEADQWGVIAVSPDYLVGMLMPPYPDDAQSWVVEFRTFDGLVWSDWTALAPCAAINRTFSKWQARVLLERTRFPYRPALRGLTVVLTH